MTLRATSVSYCIECFGFLRIHVLICRGCLDVVKDKEGNGAFGGVQFEAGLFLDCGEDTGRQVGIRCSVGERIVGGPLEGEVVSAGYPGVVEFAREDGDGVGAAGNVQAGGAGVDGGAVCLGRLDLSAALGDDERVDGEFAGLVVRGKSLPDTSVPGY